MCSRGEISSVFSVFISLLITLTSLHFNQTLAKPGGSSADALKDAALTEMQISLTLNSEPVTHEIGKLLKEFPDLKKIATSPALQQSLDIVCKSIELATIEGAKFPKDLTTKIATPPTEIEDMKSKLSEIITAYTKGNQIEPTAIFPLLRSLVDHYGSQVGEHVVRALLQRQFFKIFATASDEKSKILLKRYIFQLDVEQIGELLGTLFFNFRDVFSCSFPIKLTTHVLRSLDRIAVYVKKTREIPKVIPSKEELTQSAGNATKSVKNYLLESAQQVFTFEGGFSLRKSTTSFISGSAKLVRSVSKTALSACVAAINVLHYISSPIETEDLSSGEISKAIIEWRQKPFKKGSKAPLILSGLELLMLSENKNGEQTFESNEKAKEEASHIAKELNSSDEEKTTIDQKRFLAWELIKRIDLTVRKELMLELYTWQFEELVKDVNGEDLKTLLLGITTEASSGLVLETCLELFVCIPDMILDTAQEATKWIVEKFHLQRYAFLANFVLNEEAEGDGSIAKNPAAEIINLVAESSEVPDGGTVVQELAVKLFRSYRTFCTNGAKLAV